MTTQTTSRAVVLSLLLVLSIGAASVAFSGTTTAASNVSITPDDNTVNATGVTYTVEGTVTIPNQDTLQYVDVHLAPANVSNVTSDDVTVFIDGSQYTDGLSQFSTPTKGTVEFKLANSRSISDGDRVRVVVGNVTNPSSDFTANATLHDTGDARWQEFNDTVSIAPIDYSNLQFEANQTPETNTTVNPGEDLTVSATVSNHKSESTTYNASLKIDGVVQQYNNGTLAGNAQTTTSFVTNFSSTGTYDVTIKSLGATEITVANQVSITGGSATPDTVHPGTTVDNQQVYVNVMNVSQDGDTDTHYVEFPNALSSGLSVNWVSANDTSITSSPNLVEGYDDDGTVETVTFATSGDGGGNIPLKLTVDATVQYPSNTGTYDIDAKVVDSDGSVSKKTGVTSIQVSSTGTPIITDYAASNPSDKQIRVAFDSSEDLANISTELTDADGTTVATLDETAFTENDNGNTWHYEATTTVATDGDYTATLNVAEDGAGNDGATGESAAVTVDSTPASIVGGSATPSQVSLGATVDNQRVTVRLSDVSADGNTDTYYVEFPNTLAGDLSINSADTEGATSITSSANLVEGYDDDSTTETVRFATSNSSTGEVDITVSVDVSVSSYPDRATTHRVDALLVDSETGNVRKSNVASIQVGTPGGDDDDDDTDDESSSGAESDDAQEQSEPPTVSDFDLRADGQDVDLSLTVGDQLETLQVALTGPTESELTLAEFERTETNGSYVYTADVSTGTAGTFTATLEAAANESGSASGQSETITVELHDEVAASGVAAPPWTGVGDSHHTFSVPITNESGLTGETLRSVDIAYSDAFRDASGSVTSVSDDQNVVTLTVLAADGTVKSKMGGTDAVSVNVVDGEVRLDLTDVDSARKPTLAVGDRVVVRIQPVTNAESTGRYETSVTLESAAGDTETVDTDVSIRSQSSVAALGTTFVTPAAEQASVELSGGDAVQEVTIASAGDASGAVQVSIPSTRPSAVGDAPGSVVAAMNIDRPDRIERTTAAMMLTLSADEIEASASAIGIARYDENTGTWERLETEVVSRGNPTITVEASATETSLFAVTVPETANTTPADTTPADTTPAESTPTPAPTATADQSDATSGETTSSTGPGFGVVVALVALLAAALLASRRTS